MKPEHIVGANPCPGCEWSYGETFACKCGGRIHTEFFEESEDGVMTTEYCDKCQSPKRAD